MLTLSAVTDEDCHSNENEDDSGCQEGSRHHQHEDILRLVQQAPDDISWTIDQTAFDDLFALKKDSAPGLDGIPYGVYRCAGGLGSQFLFNAHRPFFWKVVPFLINLLKVELFKTSDIDDNGRIFRLPDAVHPFTLRNCDCKLLTSAICRGLLCYTMRCIHPSQRSISSKQMTDNIFEIETTAVAHVCKNQVFFRQTSLLPIPASITPRSSPCSRNRVA